MELDCETTATEGVTLVTVRLRNERATDRRVRVRNRLEGPVLPPRRNNEPEAGWDRDGVTSVVPAGERVSLGYACPAERESPPAVIEWVDAEDPEQEPTVADALRRLGDARPPRAVLGEDAEPVRSEASNSEHATARPANGEPAGRNATERSTVAEGAEELLRAVRERVETVEALAAADVPTAAAILETNGGLAGVQAMGTELDGDAAALRALAAEARALAARAEAATPPEDALRRLS